MGITKRFSNFYVAAVMLTSTIKYNGVFKSIDFIMILLMLGGFIIQGAMEEFLCRGIVNLILISVIFSLFTLRFNSIWATCGLETVREWTK